MLKDSKLATLLEDVAGGGGGGGGQFSNRNFGPLTISSRTKIPDTSGFQLELSSFKFVSTGIIIMCI